MEAGMKLAIFDFDGTLLMKDTLPTLGREWLRQNKPTLTYIKIYAAIIPFLFFYKIKVMSREKMKKAAMDRFDKLFTDMTKADIEDFFQKAYPYVRRHFNPQIIEEIKKAKSEGYHLVLLSGAYANLLNLVAQEFAIDTVIAVDITYKNGVFDHEREVPFIDGPSKLALLKHKFNNEKINWQASRSYGDSYSDLAVMTIVGQPVAVNPDEDLYSYVRENSWRIINN